MTIAVLVTLGLCLTLFVWGVVKLQGWRRTPPELRGDWWLRFEQEFRAYASTPQPRQPRR